MREQLEKLLSKWKGGEPSMLLKVEAFGFAAKHFTKEEISEAAQFTTSRNWGGLRNYCDQWLAEKESKNQQGDGAEMPHS